MWLLVLLEGAMLWGFPRSTLEISTSPALGEAESSSQSQVKDGRRWNAYSPKGGAGNREDGEGTGNGTVDGRAKGGEAMNGAGRGRGEDGGYAKDRGGKSQGGYKMERRGIRERWTVEE